MNSDILLILLPTVFFLGGYALGHWYPSRGPARNEKGQFVSQKQANDPPRGNVPRETEDQPEPNIRDWRGRWVTAESVSSLPPQNVQDKRKSISFSQAELQDSSVGFTQSATAAQHTDDPTYADRLNMAANFKSEVNPPVAFPVTTVPSRDWVAIQKERRQQLQAEEE